MFAVGDKMHEVAALCLLISSLLPVVYGRGVAGFGGNGNRRCKQVNERTLLSTCASANRNTGCSECPKQQFDVYELRWSLVALMAIIILFVIVCICRCHPICRQIWKKAEAPVMSRSASFVGRKISSPRKESHAQEKDPIILDV